MSTVVPAAQDVEMFRARMASQSLRLNELLELL